FFSFLFLFFAEHYTLFPSILKLLAFISSASAMPAMRINELPELILSNILCYCCKGSNCSYFNSNELVKLATENLVLLSVCKKWRMLSASIVHKHTFIVCISMESLGNIAEEDGEHTLVENTEQERIVIKSNLDIMSTDKKLHFPRDLIIHLNYSNNPIMYLCAIMDKLRSNKFILNRVSHLHLSVKTPGTTLWERIDDLQKNVLEASAMGREFVQLVPSIVSYVEDSFVGHNEILIEFIKTTAKLYSPQLNRLSCYPTTISKLSKISSKLQYFNPLYIPIDPQRFPQIYANALETLDITYDKSITWGSFKSSSKTKELNFSNLKKMNFGVVYSISIRNPIVAPAHKFNYKFIAPKLEVLHIDLCPLTISFLSSIESLKYLGTLTINIAGYGRAQLSNVRLDKSVTNSLSSGISFEDNSELPLNITACTNAIFGISNLAEKVECYIYNISGLFDIDQARWNAVTDLKLQCQTSFKEILKLISCFTKLRSLTVPYILIETTKNNEGAIHGVLNDSNTITEPLSTSIQKINLKFRNYNCTDKIKGKITGYLQKRIPTLSKILIE
ncbi:hypothetical protein BX070DRAFT_257911, partial [Coemansia spiralis]